MVSHKLPSSQPMHHFGSRYADMGGVGMPIRDAHEENPESILDEHVQRVMKTPGCQSPGPGRHSPKPRSPDGHLGKGLPVSMGTMQSGHGKHSGKSGSKLEASNLYHHKHVYHHVHHHGGVKPKEQIEAEATQRVQTNFPWNAEPHNYATKSRNYADSMGMAPNPMDSLGHRYARFVFHSLVLIYILYCTFFGSKVCVFVFLRSWTFSNFFHVASDLAIKYSIYF